MPPIGIRLSHGRAVPLPPTYSASVPLCSPSRGVAVHEGSACGFTLHRATGRIFSGFKVECRNFARMPGHHPVVLSLTVLQAVGLFSYPPILRPLDSGINKPYTLQGVWRCCSWGASECDRLFPPRIYPAQSQQLVRCPNSSRVRWDRCHDSALEAAQ